MLSSLMRRPWLVPLQRARASGGRFSRGVMRRVAPRWDRYFRVALIPLRQTAVVVPGTSWHPGRSLRVLAVSRPSCAWWRAFWTPSAPAWAPAHTKVANGTCQSRWFPISRLVENNSRHVWFGQRDDSVILSKITSCFHGQARFAISSPLAHLLKHLKDTSKIISSSLYGLEAFQLQREIDGSRGPSSFVEFNIPRMGDDPTAGDLNLLDQSIISQWDESLRNFQALRDNISRILTHYGNLPMVKTCNGKDGNHCSKLRIFFDNKDIIETQQLLIDLGITQGIVHPANNNNNNNRDGDVAVPSSILSSQFSSLNSSVEEFNYINHYSPVLSDCESNPVFQI